MPSNPNKSVATEEAEAILTRREGSNTSEPEGVAYGGSTIHIRHTTSPYAGVLSAIDSLRTRSSTDGASKSEPKSNNRAFADKALIGFEQPTREEMEVAPDPRVKATLGPRFWALLIGNDDYPQSPLEGAVNDSLAWKSYLIDFFGVPESHITHIEDADRKTMVTALYDLRDNHEIKDGDHILFAYSGHGSSYDGAVYSFEEDISQRAGPIEALCPIDRGLPAPDISDREVLLILSEIHDRTKASVTVFFDCSHSGGGIRALDLNRRSRSLGPLIERDVVQQMFLDADSHGRRDSTISIRSPTWATDTANLYRPVLLAACQDTELALEENGHGLFTSAVLRVLRSEKGRGLTCSGLIEAISVLSRDQRPRFDGEDTVLFQIDSTR